MSHLKMTEAEFQAHVARNKALRLSRARGVDPEAQKPVPALLRGPVLAGAGAIEFTVPGQPIPKGRPRLGRNHTFTPRRTVEAENVIRSVIQIAGFIPLTGPLKIEVDFFMKIPAHWNRAKTQSAMLGTIRPTNRGGDIDNLVKLLLDAAQGDGGDGEQGRGGCFHNDCQIVDLVCRKWYQHRAENASENHSHS